jgi:hypothetical protein
MRRSVRVRHRAASTCVCTNTDLRALLRADVQIRGGHRVTSRFFVKGRRSRGRHQGCVAPSWVGETMKVPFLSSVLLGIIVATGAVAAGTERVRITVSPTLSFAPSQMRVRVRLEPNADNRLLAIIADSADFYRRSEVQLDGDDAPAVIEIGFPEVPGGDYDISAVLIDNTGKACAVSRAKATVISKMQDP